MDKTKKVEKVIEDPKKIARKAAKKAKREAKRAALKQVLAFAQKNGKDPALLEAVKLITPGARIGRVEGMPNKFKVFHDLFTAKSTITEDNIWSQYKMGRKEMRGMTIGLIKKMDPKERIWVSFDSEKGVYEVQGFGPEAPKGWTGYTPVTVDEEEIV